MGRSVITVIVPVLGGADGAPGTVRSALEQDDVDVDLLLVHRAGEIVPDFAGEASVRRLATDDDRPSEGIRRAWAAARGEWVLWLLPGEGLYPAALARIVEESERRPEVDVWTGDANFVDDDGEVLGAWNGDGWPPDRLPSIERLASPLFLFRRGVCGGASPVRGDDDAGYPAVPIVRLAVDGVAIDNLGALLSRTRRPPRLAVPSLPALASMIEIASSAGRAIPPDWRLAYGRAAANARGLARGRRGYRRVVLDLARRAPGNGTRPTSAVRTASEIGLARLRDEVDAVWRGAVPTLPGRLAWLDPALARGLARARSSLGGKIFRFHTRDPRPLRTPPPAPTMMDPSTSPRISIVTPSLDQAPFLERTLTSVLAQGYPDLEYVVRDGGSTDGSVDILRRWEDRLTSWTSEPDGGQARAINLGFRETTGEIMAWLNSDDLLLPGALATVASHFRDHPDVDVVYGHRILVDEDDHEIGRWVLPRHDDRLLSWVDYVPQETLFWRRRVWERVGGALDESFRFAMDWDLLLRLRDAGARFERIPRFLGAFRVSAEQKSSRWLLTTGRLEMDRLRRRALGSLPSAREIGRAIRPYVTRHWILDRWTTLREGG